jgi:hypothetical protein
MKTAASSGSMQKEAVMAKTPDWASPLAKRNNNGDPKNVDADPVRTNVGEKADDNSSAWLADARAVESHHLSRSAAAP